MGSFEAEGNEGFGVSVSVPLPCPDSQPDYPLRHAQDSHIYRVCVRLPTTVELFPQAVDDVLPDGERGVIRFRSCASKSSRFDKRGFAILVFVRYINSMNQFRIQSRRYPTIFVFLFTNIRNLNLVKLCRGSKIKICECETSVNDQPSQFYTL